MASAPIRYRRGVAQAITIPEDLPREVLPWAQAVVREINRLRDDVERIRKRDGNDPLRNR